MAPLNLLQYGWTLTNGMLSIVWDSQANIQKVRDNVKFKDAHARETAVRVDVNALRNIKTAELTVSVMLVKIHIIMERTADGIAMNQQQ